MQSLGLGDEGMFQGCENTHETEQKSDCDFLVESSRLAEQLDVKSNGEKKKRKKKSNGEGKPDDTET